MEGQGASKHQKGVEDTDDLESCERTEGASVPKGLGRMFTRGREDRRGNLTYQVKEGEQTLET
jgi:hypothetical protein